MISLKTESEFWGDQSAAKLFLFQGEGNRQWVGAHYPRSCNSAHHIRILIPEKPDDVNLMLDSCMAFISEVFEKSSSFPKLNILLNSRDTIDLDIQKPKGWDILRGECLKYMGRLNVKTFIL